MFAGAALAGRAAVSVFNVAAKLFGSVAEAGFGRLLGALGSEAGSLRIAAAEAREGIQVTSKGVNIVRNHVAQFEFAPNDAMVSRLENAIGRRVTGADAHYYLHELSEATMMGRGLSYEAAHAGALQKYAASPFSLYHPDVIRQFPQLFNSNWRAFWGIR